MRRVLFRLGGVTFYSYSTMLSIGVVLGLFAQQWAARRMGLDVARSSIATLLLLPPALLGARLLFVVSQWATYRHQPHRILQSSEGGAAMYGGIIVAVPLSVPLLLWMGVPFGAFWDAASFTILVGMIITRIGCFLAGCCAGVPTERWYGVYLPGHNDVWRKRVPTQALEAAWGVAILVGALVIRAFPFPGALFLYTVITYSIGRLGLESVREQQDRARGVIVNQALSLVFVAVSMLAALAVTWRN